MGLCAKADPCLPAERHGSWQPGCKKSRSWVKVFFKIKYLVDRDSPDCRLVLFCR